MSIFDPGFVEAYSTKTGEKQVIPAAWLEDPLFASDFRLTPKQSAASRSTPGADVELPAGAVNETWTIPQLTKYAADHDIDVAGAKVKADYLTAINNHAAATATAESGSNTPDAGDEE